MSLLHTKQCACVSCADDGYAALLRSREVIQAVLAIAPEDYATKSRDYGRGFAEAIRLVRETVEKGSQT